MQTSDPRNQLAPTTLSVFDRVHVLCGEFAEAWSSGARPDISTYLARVADDTRVVLLRNLVDYELRKLREAGEQPTIEGYIERFPKYASQIRTLFLEARSTQSGNGSDGGTLTIDMPVARRLGSYELTRELGRGGMGCVYEAIHVRHRNRVALKDVIHAQIENVKAWAVDGASLELYQWRP